MYVRDVVISTTTYEKNLRGFERVNLKQGESKIVSFPIVPDDLIIIDVHGHRIVEPGEFKVMIGSSYIDIRLTESFFVKESPASHLKTIEQAKGSHVMMDPTLK